MFTISTVKTAVLFKQISILSVIFVSYGFTFFNVQAATIPDAATTPGRVLPREAPQFPPIPVDDGTLDIPPVIDRPLSVDEGDRVMVSEFILQGVQSHEEYGISHFC